MWSCDFEQYWTGRWRAKSLRTPLRRSIPVSLLIPIGDAWPYGSYIADLTQKAVCADLYQEDLVAIHSSQAQFVGSDEGTPSAIITMGLDLKEEQ